MGEPSSTPPAGASLISIGEELWLAGGLLRDVLSWVSWVAVWLIGLGVLALLDLSLGGLLVPLYVYILVGCALFAVTAPMELVRGRKAGRAYEDWARRFLPFRYTVQFEMLPVSLPIREEDILQRYQVLFPGLSQESGSAIGMLLPAVKPMKGEEIRGKSGVHRFNLVLLTSTGSGWGLFVRRFGSDALVTADDLRKFRDEVKDVVFRHPAKNFVAGAFSEVGFAPDAIELAEGEPAFGKVNAQMDLIQETDTGYRIIWVSPS